MLHDSTTPCIPTPYRRPPTHHLQTDVEPVQHVVRPVPVQDDRQVFQQRDGDLVVLLAVQYWQTAQHQALGTNGGRRHTVSGVLMSTQLVLGYV